MSRWLLIPAILIHSSRASVYSLALFIAFLCQSGEKQVELKDVVWIDSLCYTKQNTITPFTGSVVSYWVDGALTSKTAYKNGKANGPHIEWWGNQQVRSIKYYVDNIEQGEYLAYFETGEISACGYFKNGECSGTWCFYEMDGTIRSKIECP